MVAKAEHSVIDSVCSLYKQSRSNNYYVRIKLKNGGWHRASTQTANLKEAKEIATKLFVESQVKLKANLPQNSRTFSSIAKAKVSEWESMRNTANWKESYRGYINVLNTYAIPYFGNTNMDNIKTKYGKYTEHVESIVGRKLKRSTINNHNAALTAVIDDAVDKGYANLNTVPKLANKGLDAEQRGSFTIEEYRLLIKRLRKWKGLKTHRAKDAEMKLLLYDYVLILANSGIRSGREALDIKWNNISIVISKSGKELVKISVLMKKGRSGSERRRNVYVRNSIDGNAIKILTRLKDRNNKLKDKALEDILSGKVNDKVFVLSNGYQPKRLDGTFEDAIAYCDLTYGTDEKKRTLYSLRHFYATQELIRGHITVAQLALQMGTSIKMIEKHYSHLLTDDVAEALSGYEAEAFI